MSDYPSGYEYPPSKHILRFGPIQVESHHYAKGYAIFKNKQFKRRKCTFEVAYTQDCKVIVVCYLEIRFRESENLFTRCEKLIGREIHNDDNVVVEDLFSRYWTRTHFGSDDFTITYEARCAKIFLPKYEAPKHSTKYYPHFEVTGIELPFWLDRNHNAFKEESHGKILFPINQKGNIELSLLFQREAEKRDFDNQSTARLAIPPNSVPQGWTTSEIADLWCSLASLALGRDVQWTTYFTPIDHKTNLERVWETKHVRGRGRFHSCIISRFHTEEDIKQLQDFVQSSFQYISSSNSSRNHINNYIFAIRQYVDYCTIRTATVEGRIRLIATLVEELLHLWEQDSENKVTQIISKKERKKLDEILKKAMIEKAEEYLKENVHNLDKIVKKVIHIVQNNMRSSFRERLEFFFSENGINLDNNQLMQRINAFIDTRNSIAHQGSLAWLNNDVDKQKLIQLCDVESHAVDHEIENVEMMIPLMIFSIFKYSGYYRDTLSHDHQQYWFSNYSPSNESSDSQTSRQNGE